MADELQLAIADNPERRRYLVRLGDRVVGYSEYDLEPSRIVFTHTVVKPEFEGRGVGSRLAKFALDDARNRGLRIVPVCPFIRAYLKRHQEYADIVDIPGT
jgi:predicted GNAT family acetyltransferase